MSANQPPTTDELEAIKARGGGLVGAQTALRLVAEVERLQALVDDAHEDWKHGNASGGGSIHHTREEAEAAMAAHNHRRDNRTGYDLLEPRAPESTGIFRRLVTQWVPAE